MFLYGVPANVDPGDLCGILFLWKDKGRGLQENYVHPPRFLGCLHDLQGDLKTNWLRERHMTYGFLADFTIILHFSWILFRNYSAINPPPRSVLARDGQAEQGTKIESVS